MSFLEQRHPEWQENHERWDFTWDNYSGEYAAHDRVDLFTRKTKNIQSDKYLHRKVQAETPEAYLERIYTSDPVLEFPTAVDSINGLAYGKQEDTTRDWGALGDPDEEGTIAAKLWRDADNEGTNWMPLMKQMGIKQTALHKMWVLVDGIKESQFQTEDGEVESEVVGEASIHLIDPQSVVDWYPNTNPTEVLVKEEADMRGSIMDTDAKRNQDTYILYTVDGWTRYIDDEGVPTAIDSGEYEFYKTKDRQERILPIFPVELPMPRPIGYLLAIKQNHIYNAKSIRDFSIRNTSFSWLKIVADDKQFQGIMSNIKDGFRVLRQDPDVSGAGHEYVAPPSDHLQEAGNVLQKNREAFANSAFKSYGDAARQATATEIRQESRSGIEAFLNLLVTSLDEFENKCLFLLEQIYFPETPSNWGQAYVERSKDFAPKNIEEAMANISNVVENASRANAMSTKRMVELLNPEWTEEQVEEEVERINKERGGQELPDNMVGG
jgi:hypothetical protein